MSIAGPIDRSVVEQIVREIVLSQIGGPADEPELVNTDPFNDGWMIKVACDDISPLEKFLDGEAYNKMISETQ